jgi:hypothetical protein
VSAGGFIIERMVAIGTTVSSGLEVAKAAREEAIRKRCANMTNS